MLGLQSLSKKRNVLTPDHFLNLHFRVVSLGVIHKNILYILHIVKH